MRRVRLYTAITMALLSLVMMMLGNSSDVTLPLLSVFLGGFAVGAAVMILRLKEST